MKPIAHFALRLLVTAIVAWIAALTVILGVLYFSNGGADFSVTDIAGFGGIVIIGSAILCSSGICQCFYGCERARGHSCLLLGYYSTCPLPIRTFRFPES